MAVGTGDEVATRQLLDGAAAAVATGRELSQPGIVIPAGGHGGERLRIALVSEGTYPFHLGGVSVWCDQLIRGIEEHRFTAVALTVTGQELSLWEQPENLDEVINVPLWGRAPKAPRGARQGVPGWRFGQAYQAFAQALVAPPATGPAATRHTGETFALALRGLFEYAQRADLGAALLSDRALTQLMDAWQAAGVDRAAHSGGAGSLTLAEALMASDLIEHTLRPLSRPPLDVDICHLAMNGLSALVGLTSKWACGARIVMSEHGVYLRERYLSMVDEDVPHAVKVLLLNFFRALAVAAYISADVLAPHSSYNRRWALYHGADEDRMWTMYNGIDPAEFPVAETEPDVPTVVFMGRVDPIKDLHTLIKAFALVRAEVPNARLRMFGPVATGQWGYYDSCRALIDELGLAHAATFEGRVTRPTEAYHAGHLVVLSSISEGFPYTVVEAMATGRPVVCTNVGGVAEAVGDAGFVVPPRDHRAIADGCLSLLLDGELRRWLGTAARGRVLNRFTLDQSLNDYRRVYQELS
ncbi:GT4 family glycosyltransferase PelF [Phytohabitans rumicis]|uniref:Lipopolysaccharide glycosyltransferase, putative n=1 Tax=Phytohabitans rumicis TaxID=1076125 RepID=A0A6V8KVQ2_9ACTN|nr:GT4 family glycosyltransferase PelF [Phytohabitans rumicis]GFJ89172.1 lipopolysaccharide glycosyltransferase, putative [Phytohabitans rumicis]